MENINFILDRLRQDGEFNENYIDVLEEFLLIIISPDHDLKKRQAEKIIFELESMHYRTNKVQVHENLIGEFSNQFSLFCIALLMSEFEGGEKERDYQIKSIVMVFKFIAYYYAKGNYLH